MDGGIYFSPIGWESFISWDNPTYTRSLLADYTPYFVTGAKVTWAASSKVTAQFHVVNGWQIVSENNPDKSFIARVDWQATPALALAYAFYAGNEQLDTLPARTRYYNQLLAKVSAGHGWDFWGTFDVGAQTVPDASTQTWYGAVIIGRKALSKKVAVVGRVEGHSDRDQVLILTGTPDGFRTIGGSIGVDVQPEEYREVADGIARLFLVGSGLAGPGRPDRIGVGRLHRHLALAPLLTTSRFRRASA